MDSPDGREDRIKAGGNIGNLSFLELLLILSCYAFFFYKFVPGFRAAPNWAGALVLAAEAETILLLLIRRPAQSFSAAPTAWFLAMASTVVPPLLIYPALPLNPAWVGATFVAVGLGARMVCTLFLGRSFGLVAANRGVQRGGPYRIVRHPIYASYLVIHVGILWLNPTLWNVAAYAACWSLMIPRLLVEESHLRQDPAYVKYAQVVRYRLIPGVF